MYGTAYAMFKDFGRDNSGDSAGAVVLASLAVLVLVVVQLFVIQWLWNTVFVRVVTFARPLPSLLYTLGLLVLVAMVHPGVAMA